MSTGDPRQGQEPRLGPGRMDLEPQDSGLRDWGLGGHGVLGRSPQGAGPGLLGPRRVRAGRSLVGTPRDPRVFGAEVGPQELPSLPDGLDFRACLAPLCLSLLASR